METARSESREIRYAKMAGRSDVMANEEDASSEPSAGFLELLIKHAAAAIDKQMSLMDIVGKNSWKYSMSTGILSFGPEIQFKAQVLGSWSDSSETWMWSWKNKASNIPEGLQAASLRLKSIGEEKSIPELTEGINQTQGSDIAILASGLLSANAYYRGPYPGGAAFLLIQDENFPSLSKPNTIDRIRSVFLQTISSVPIPDHKAALIGYLEWCNLQYEEIHDSNRIVIFMDGVPSLSFEFDVLNRLHKLEAVLHQIEEGKII